MWQAKSYIASFVGKINKEVFAPDTVTFSVTVFGNDQLSREVGVCDLGVEGG
jgi:hypothetical protein